jgi:hypothetical protein
MRRIALLLLALVLLPATYGQAGFTPAPVPMGAWQTFTPVISSSSGTITTASGSGYFQVTGKRVDFQIDMAITTNGTGAGFLQATLPLQNGPGAFEVTGHELLATGKQVVGFINNNATQILIRYYDATYPGANSTRFVVSGSYMLP